MILHTGWSYIQDGLTYRMILHTGWSKHTGWYYIQDDLTYRIRIVLPKELDSLTYRGGQSYLHLPKCSITCMWCWGFGSRSGLFGLQRCGSGSGLFKTGSRSCRNVTVSKTMLLRIEQKSITYPLAVFSEVSLFHLLQRYKKVVDSKSFYNRTKYWNCMFV